MQAEERSRAPWVNDRTTWGRIRLTHRMWRTTYFAIATYLNALWDLHRSQPNPSAESRASLEEIRELQKVMDNLKGLGMEKGWPTPGVSGGNSTTE